MTKTITFRAPDELATLLEKRCADDERTVTSFIVGLLWGALAEPVVVARRLATKGQIVAACGIATSPTTDSVNRAANAIPFGQIRRAQPKKVK